MYTNRRFYDNGFECFPLVVYSWFEYSNRRVTISNILLTAESKIQFKIFRYFVRRRFIELRGKNVKRY